MPLPTEIVFGQVLKRSRMKRGLSQEALGFESGYHRTYISLLERGLRCPTISTIFDLSAALNISPSKMVKEVETVLLSAKKGRKK